MKKIFEQYMVWIMLLLFAGMLLIKEYCSIGTWNLNRTIGWGWDYSNFLWWNSLISLGSLAIFTAGYGLLYYLKKPANTNLSILHLSLIFLFVIAPFYDIVWNYMIAFLGYIVFFFNIGLSIKR